LARKWGLEVGIKAVDLVLRTHWWGGERRVTGMLDSWAGRGYAQQVSFHWVEEWATRPSHDVKTRMLRLGKEGGAAPKEYSSRGLLPKVKKKTRINKK